MAVLPTPEPQPTNDFFLILRVIEYEAIILRLRLLDFLERPLHLLGQSPFELLLRPRARQLGGDPVGVPPQFGEVAYELMKSLTPTAHRRSDVNMMLQPTRNEAFADHRVFEGE
jgi:hypothetical protein